MPFTSPSNRPSLPTIRGACCLIACLLSGVALSLPAVESGTELFPQAPGFYRQIIGSLRVTALFDGVVFLSRDFLKDINYSVN